MPTHWPGPVATVFPPPPHSACKSSPAASAAAGQRPQRGPSRSRRQPLGAGAGRGLRTREQLRAGGGAEGGAGHQAARPGALALGRPPPPRTHPGSAGSPARPSWCIPRRGPPRPAPPRPSQRRRRRRREEQNVLPGQKEHPPDHGEPRCPLPASPAPPAPCSGRGPASGPREDLPGPAPGPLPSASEPPRPRLTLRPVPALPPPAQLLPAQPGGPRAPRWTPSGSRLP